MPLFGCSVLTRSEDIAAARQLCAGPCASRSLTYRNVLGPSRDEISA